MRPLMQPRPGPPRIEGRVLGRWGVRRRVWWHTFVRGHDLAVHVLVVDREAQGCIIFCSCGEVWGR